jgi:regulatory protein
MEITKLTPLPRGGGRVGVHVDGQHRLTAAAEVLADRGLGVGSVVTPALLNAVEEEDAAWRAREAALRLLAHRPRSTLELARALTRKGFSAGAVEACLEMLSSAGLLDDEAFARSIARERVRNRPRGRRAILGELRERGIGEGVAAGAVEAALAEEEVGELDLARAALRAFRERPGEERTKRYRRLRAFLARRGFTGETARRAAREARE